MIQAVDGEVTYLKRISMGPLTLDENLPKGAYRQLTKEEIQQLYMERK
jgi:16S rRNA pseudouridine516 synthase